MKDLKLEVGKCYETRNGNKAIIYDTDMYGFAYVVFDHRFHHYCKYDGERFEDDGYYGDTRRFDIIGLWKGE